MVSASCLASRSGSNSRLASVSLVEKVINREDLSREQQELDTILRFCLAGLYQVQHIAKDILGVG
jgi:hypothetical protein